MKQASAALASSAGTTARAEEAATTGAAAPARRAVPRVAVLCDLVEEHWPSMDLVAEMLVGSVSRNHAAEVDIQRICPPMRHRFTRFRSFDAVGEPQRIWFNADRAINRFVDYPRLLRRERSAYDLYHVVDHAYGHLVHSLPAERTVVTCHDLHTFECLLEPRAPKRSGAFRAMTRHILRGLTRASRVVLDTAAVRDEVLAHGLVPPERLTVIHLGVHPSFTAVPDPLADAEAARILGPERPGAVDLLHVGGTFTRKRIDLLLEIFAAVRREHPEARLVRVGGQFTDEQNRQVDRLGIGDAIVVAPFVSREVLSAIYRRATLVLIPSEVEGFGLPVVESMGCGTPVLASALPVLQEVGGDAATYCPVGDIDRWRDAVVEMLHERATHPERWEARRARGLAQAARFTWSEYARKLMTMYGEVLNQCQ